MTKQKNDVSILRNYSLLSVIREQYLFLFFVVKLRFFVLLFFVGEKPKLSTSFAALLHIKLTDKIPPITNT